MPKTFDVGIIGGGIIGCAVAYYLSKAGVSVVVLEKDHICSGTSNANQGGIAVQLFDPKTIPLALASSELFSELSNELELDLEYRRSGTLNVALHAYQVPLLKRRYDELIQMGMDVRLWNDHQLRSFPGGDAKPFLSVCESPHDAQVNPLKATYAFALGAKRLGARIMLHAPVAQMKTDQKTIRSIILKNGEEIACGRVVCAAGAWSKEIGRGVGLDVPVEPQRGQLIITEQVPRSEYPYILDADYLTSAYGIKPEGEDEAARMRLKMGIGASFAQELPGNWTIGASRDLVGCVKTNSPEVLKALAKYLLEFMPWMKRINCIRFIAGYRPYCIKDGRPILGRVLDLSGFYLATGHGGEGVALAPITGKLVAEEITTGKTSLPIDDFRFERFFCSH